VTGWVAIVLILAGIIFAIKIAYVFSVILSISTTQGALFVSTSAIRIRAFLDAVPMKSGDLFVDLGCGDGRVLRAARKRYGVRALGYEVNPLAYFMAVIKSLGMKGVKIKYKNFHRADIGRADVVFCYLFPDVMKEVADKLAGELPSESWVVSCNFPLPGWSPRKVIRPASGRHSDPIYIYRVG